MESTDLIGANLYYDSDRKVFCIEYPYDYPSIKEYKRFNNFKKQIGERIYDVNLLDYEPTVKELEGLDIKRLRVSSDYLLKMDIYDPSFHDTCIKSTEEYVINRFSGNGIASYDSELLKIREIDDVDGTKSIFYISDLHLDYKLQKMFPVHATEYEVREYFKSIIRGFCEDINYTEGWILIAGDVSYNFEVYKIFFEEMVDLVPKKSIVVVLGNHELWTDEECPDLSKIYSRYAKLLRSMKIAFLQNDLLGFVDKERVVIREEELLNASFKEIREFCISSEYLVFGGIGFSGLNMIQNFNSGQYKSTITSRDVEIEQSKKINRIYLKLKQIIADLNLIVLTHMPLSDWSEESYVPNWYYISGHTHKSEYRRDNDVNLFSDNQIGYYSEQIHLKKFTIGAMSDIFIDHSDGVHTITAEQYRSFYRSKGLGMQFNRKNDILMIKKAGYYCFFLKEGSSIKLLDGGRVRKTNHNVDHYSEKIELYAKNVDRFFAKYNAMLKKLSEDVRSIGGSGYIHGCIVDIDFYNHLYLNPFDGKIIPYYATDVANKYVYDNLRSLLYYKNKQLYLNYESMQGAVSSNSLILSRVDSEIKRGRYVADKEIYRISRIFKTFQYASNSHVIRNWNDYFEDSEYDEESILNNICLLGGNTNE